jgi:hypothetical protein
LSTAEAETNGDSKSTKERGPSSVGSLGSSLHDCTRDFCPALAALVGPVQNIFSLPYTTCISIHCPHHPASLTGSRAGSPVSYCVSLVR